MLNWWRGLGAVAAMGAVAAAAQDVVSERFQMDGVAVTVLAHSFLTEEELVTLRLVGQNRDALSLFVPEGEGYAALAVAPSDGFVRAGVPAPSATALSGLPDLATARGAALDACNAARTGGERCQIVLEVAPE